MLSYQLNHCRFSKKCQTHGIVAIIEISLLFVPIVDGLRCYPPLLGMDAELECIFFWVLDYYRYGGCLMNHGDGVCPGGGVVVFVVVAGVGANTTFVSNLNFRATKVDIATLGTAPK